MKRAPIEIIKEVFHADSAELGEDVDLRDLSSWDSLNHMTFIAGIEQEYDVVLTGDEIAEMLTLGSITRILRDNHGVAL